MKSYLNTLALSAAIIVSAACGSVKKGVKIVVDDAEKKIDVLYNGKLFTSYIYPSDLEKPALYPLYTAKGTVITRGFPRNPRPGERADHPHQVGLWFNFGDVNGIDFWNNSYAIPVEKKADYGSIRHRAIKNIQNGSNFGILTVTADWVDSSGKPLLTEETQFTFSGEGDLRIIERASTLTALHDTVIFADNKEGLIAIRMDRAFEEPSDKPDLFLDADGKRAEMRTMDNAGVNGAYRNSDGLEKDAVWGKPAKWVCLSASKAREKISVAIIDHRDNPGYPARFHARGYGLFAANNMGSRAFDRNVRPFGLTLSPGQSVAFRHRVVIKSGSFASNEELNRQFDEFNR
jgi:hypothetical protein